MAKLMIRWKESVTLLLIIVFTITLFFLLGTSTLPRIIPTGTGGDVKAVAKREQTTVINNQIVEPPHGVQTENAADNKDTAVIKKPVRHVELTIKPKSLKRSGADAPLHKKLGKQQFLPKAKSKKSHKQVVIAAALCSKFGDGGPLVKAAMMVKSLIISAKLYNISKMDIYMFLEYREYERMLLQKLEQFGFKNHMRGIDILSRHVQDAIPAQYQQHMLYHKTTRCAYAKIFLPSALENVDSVLYLDIDIIVTGNPFEIWKHFNKMNDMQLVGLTRDSEPEYPTGLAEYLEKFGDIPLPLPKGVNTGVLFMNLTRMRTNKWEDKLLQVYKDYKKVFKKPKSFLNDQRIINIFLYYANFLFYILKCHYNLRSTHCASGLYCKDAKNDPLGIHVIHGAGSQLQVWGVFHEMFKIYDRVNLQNPKVKFLKKEVTEKVRKAYSLSTIKALGKKDTRRTSKCYGTIDKLLFPYFFTRR